VGNNIIGQIDTY